MNGAKFSWPPLSDSCAAQKWLISHRVSLIHNDLIEVPRWRFEDGSALTTRGDDIYAVTGLAANKVVWRRAKRRACWRRFRVAWQRRPIWGDPIARAQYRKYIRDLETMFWGGWA